MASWDDIKRDRSSALDDVEFLARSPNRVDVLWALAEGPRTRHELRELADASRITIRRLLDDLIERGWITHRDGQYETTTRGRVIANEFERMTANISIADRLDDALRWLPVDEFEFDLAHLNDATVLRATSWESQTEAIRHAADRVHQSQTIRGTAIGFSHEVVEAIRSLVLDEGGTFEAVIDASALKMIRGDKGLRRRFRDVITSRNGALYRYGGAAPLHMVMTIDERAVICGHVDQGPPPGTLESVDRQVLSWAQSYYEQALAASEPIHIEQLEPEQRDST